jgi:hypothetical protein
VIQHRTRAWVTACVVAVVASTALPALPAVAQGGADVAVELRVVDDVADPQRFAVVIRNNGPDTAQHTTLGLDAGGQALAGSTADPQPGSAADGVACTADATRLDCQWAAIGAGEEVAFTVDVDVQEDGRLAAALSTAGTPDPNPTANNADELLLRPAVADLSVQADAVEVEDGVRVDVVVEHRGGRPTEAELRVAGPPDGAPAACQVDDDGFSCPLGLLGPGERRTLSRTFLAPEPDHPALELRFTVRSLTVPDPDPADDTAGVVVDPRDRRPADVRRHQGAERIRTAVAIAAHLHPDGAPAAVLARADDPADALAGAPLAAHVGGPILLTGGDALADPTAAELERLLPPGATVHLLGGEAALAPAVADRVAALGLRVARHAGENRYATSAAVATALGDPAEVAFADGDGFSDALVAAAGMAARGGALLLTSGDRLPAETARWAAEATWAVGGGAARAVPDAEELTGTTAAETSVVVAAALFDEPVAVGLATAAGYPDALAGSPLTAAAGGALLLTPPDRLDRAVAGYLASTTSVDTAHLFGGPGALSTAVEDEVRHLLAR